MLDDLTRLAYRDLHTGDIIAELAFLNAVGKADRFSAVYSKRPGVPGVVCEIPQRLAHHAAHIHRLNALRLCGRGGIPQADALQLQLLHQAIEILQCFPGKLPAGEIGVLDPLQLLFDLDHGLQIAQRHRSPIHVGYTGEIRGGIFQQLHDSRQCQHLAVQRDGLIHLEIAVFIQQPQSVQHGKHLVAAAAGQGGELLQNRLIFLGCVAQRIAQRCKRRCRQHGQHHAADEQYAKYSFFHWLFSSCSCRFGLSAPPFFWFSLFLSRKHSAVIAAAAAKETTATST